MPGLQRVTDELAGRGVALVTVMLQGTPEAGRAFAARTGLHAPALIGSRELARRYQIAAYPWTLVFGRDGRAVHAIRGGREEEEFRQTFEKLLD